jgi:hypothetical protein
MRRQRLAFIMSPFSTSIPRVNGFLLSGICAGLILLLCLPLVVTPWTLSPFVFGKAVYARGLILVIFALWLVLRLRDPTYGIPRSWVLLAFTVYVIAALLSAVTGPSSAHSLASSYSQMTGAWDLVLWLLFALVAASVLRSPGAWRSLLNWGLLVALALSLLALAQVLGLGGQVYLAKTCRLTATLGNPSYLGAILVVTTLTAAGLMARSFLPDPEGGSGEQRNQSPSGGRARPSPWRRARGSSGILGHDAGHALGWPVHLWRVFWAAGIVLGTWVLFHTDSRSALIGLVAGALAMPLALAIWGNRKALAPVALGSGGVLLFVAILYGLGETTGFPSVPGCRGAGGSSQISHLARATVSQLGSTAVDQPASTALDQPAKTAVDQPVGTAVDQLVGTAVKEKIFVSDGSIAHRFAYIDVGLKAFLDRPIFGWGHDNFGSAFERFAEATIYRYGLARPDQAHNQPIEELATHGVVGTLSFAALWLALLWAVVRRRRPPKEEILAYGVLGALAGFFVQNLFLFYTPATLLYWVVLVAWVAGQETKLDPGLERGEVTPGPAATRRSSCHGRGRLASPPWGPAALTVALIPVIGYAMYHLVYVPYSANRTFMQAYTGAYPLPQRLALASRSFNASPGMSNMPKELMFGLLWDNLEGFSAEERRQIAAFVLYETQRTLERDPSNVRIVAIGIAILQPNASPEGLKRLDLLLRHLRENAPERVYTYSLSANQELLKGNYREALQISKEFEALTPWVPDSILELKQAATDALADGG